MKHLIFLFFLLFANLIFGQTIDDLVSSKKIGWVIETEYEYFLSQRNAIAFDGKKDKKGRSPYNLVNVKFDLDQCSPAKDFFAEMLFSEIRTGQKKIYDVNDPNKLVNFNSFIDTTTVSTIDMNTYEERLVRQSVDPVKSYKSYIVKQIWYYDSKKSKIKNRVVEMRPVKWEDRKRINPNGEFRIPMNNKPTKKVPSINDENIGWMAIGTDHVQLENAKGLKGDVKTALSSFLFEDTKNQKVDIYSGTCSDSPIPKDKFSKLYILKDTTATFDPNTYEETIVITANPLSFENVDGQETTQIWYFDKASNSVNSYLKAIGPYKRSRRSSRTIFHVRFD